MLCNGLLRIQRALQDTLKSSTIEDSFIKTGMCPFDIDKILAQCKDERTESVDNTIKENMDDLVKIFRDNGQLKDSDIKAIGILPITGKKYNKEKLTISRQRAVLLSHDQSLARWRSLKDLNIKAITDKKNRKASQPSTRKRSISSMNTISIPNELLMDEVAIPIRKNPPRAKKVKKSWTFSANLKVTTIIRN
jgi:hypothetical protein